jgi:hypothetical protein
LLEKVKPSIIYRVWTTIYAEKNSTLLKMDVLDDFPLLWRWFEEDDTLHQLGFEEI